MATPAPNNAINADFIRFSFFTRPGAENHFRRWKVRSIFVYRRETNRWESGVKVKVDKENLFVFSGMT